MALAALQELLARLYTDKESRNAFFADREKVFSNYDLDANEKAQLLALSHQQVEAFALSLVRKRMHEVRDQLSFTASRMGAEFNKLFFEYANAHVPSGINKHSEDAIRFAEFIIHHLKRNKGDEATIEIGKFELNRIRRYFSRKRLIIERYSYPVTSIIRSMSVNSNVEPKKKSELHIFYRSSAGRGFMMWKIGG